MASEGRTSPRAHCSTVPAARTSGRPSAHLQRLDGGGVLHTRSGVSLSREEKEATPLAATWTDLEVVTQGKVSQTQKQNHCTTSLRRRI